MESRKIVIAIPRKAGPAPELIVPGRVIEMNNSAPIPERSQILQNKVLPHFFS